MTCFYTTKQPYNSKYIWDNISTLYKFHKNKDVK